ncbi:MAG: RnfABCDGE type electron transport complex subunit B, partial [Spirochaetales bacterium]
MVFSGILYSFIAVTALGIIFGIGLAIAGKLLAVKKDEKIITVEGLLPGINCGACGFAGCSAYAEAVVDQGAELTRCAPGGQETAKSLAQFMGVEVVLTGERQVAQVCCRGTTKKVKYKYEYRGLTDCNALHTLSEGNKSCRYGCLALGSCIKVCPVDAIHYDEEGGVWVTKEDCITCGK